MRQVIVIGDMTTHGGIVTSGDDTFTVLGKGVARVGDLIYCPKCKGEFHIAEGIPTMLINGKYLAVHGMMTTCGALLIASSGTPFWVDAGVSYQVKNTFSSSTSAQNTDVLSLQLEARDMENNVIADLLYYIELNGKCIAQGRTNKHGLTEEIIRSNNVENFDVYWGEDAFAKINDFGDS